MRPSEHQSRRRPGGRSGGPPQRHRRSSAGRCRLCAAALAALAGAAVLWGCRGGGLDRRTRQGASGGGPSILIVVLDGCRPDKLGVYGFDRPTSPNIDALAADPDAVTFLRHYAQAAWTKPSTASLFTGLFPGDHGVVIGREERPAPGVRFYRTQALSPDLVTLAERLSEAGFYTFGVHGIHHLSPDYGFDQGFDEYYGPSDVVIDRERLERTVALLGAISGRFFGYLHLMACHYPYGKFGRDQEYLKRFGFDYDEAGRAEQGVDFTHLEMRRAINERRLELTAEDVRFLHLVYEAKLRKVDRAFVGPLIQALKELGRYDNTLLLITADHGEELYEHGGYSHAHALWNEVIHVPLIVKYPRGQKPRSLPARVSRITSVVDVHPSLLARVGLSPTPGIRGLPSLAGVFADYAFAENESEWALVDGGYKLIESRRGPLLFDLVADAGERRNLAGALPHRLRSLRSRQTALRGAAVVQVEAPTLDSELSGEAEENLRSLGYID